MSMNKPSVCAKGLSTHYASQEKLTKMGHAMKRDQLEGDGQALTDESSGANTAIASQISIPDVQPTIINAPAQIGLIMPNPRANVYTGVEYRMGYVDPGPAPKVNGALRVVTPLLTFSNRTTHVFPDVGSLDADPGHHPDSVGWCSVNLAAAPYTFPFKFNSSGWHQFVINATWGRPTITGDNLDTDCSLPITQQYTFFGARAVSVSPSPTTGGLIKSAPAYTVWVDLTWRTPGPLPLEQQTDTPAKKIIVGLSIAGVFVAIGSIVVIILLLRRRRIAKREALAFSRLKPRDRAELLNRRLPPLPPGHAELLAETRYAWPAPQHGGPAYVPLATTRHHLGHRDFRTPY